MKQLYLVMSDSCSGSRPMMVCASMELAIAMVKSIFPNRPDPEMLVKPMMFVFEVSENPLKPWVLDDYEGKE